ncbi:MAG TPA: RNA polymerase sigma factor RpoH [Acetobacteraceae bacterium]|jgi:RNA polymerase sigma-32 factor|nr:RNA polymerase sigma factor RpoH [Acetobacteraceae bacterium]
MVSSTYSVAPEYSLSRYLQRIRTYPILSVEEELELARRWRERQDAKAADKLVTSHLRLVAKVAMRYRGYGLPVGELISEGNAGMMQAVRRFDPDRGVRLATYAVWWIRAAIQEYVLHSWSLVKIGTTAAQKKLFFNLRRLKAQIQGMQEGEMSTAQVTSIADALRVPAQDVISMNRRLEGPDHSLNVPVHADGQGEWQDWLVDDRDTQDIVLAEREETTRRKALVAKAWTTLNDRERRILIARRLNDNPETLGTLAEQHGISRERVRQIEVRAIEKLRRVATAQGAGNSRAQLSC